MHSSQLVCRVFVPLQLVLLVGLSTLGAPSLSAQTGWSKRSPAQSPSARYYVRLAYDSARKRVVLFGGGQSGTTSLGDTWEFDGNTWTQMKPPSPTPAARQLHAMTYDAKSGKVVLFGGGAGSVTRNDTWEWDGKKWTDVTPTKATDSPPKRVGHAMAYDLLRKRVVMFGVAGTKNFDGVWEWDGSVWTEQKPTTKPPARGDIPMTYDLNSKGALIYGGQGASSVLSDTWVWNGSTWSKKSVTGATPGARRNHALAYNQARGRTVLFGGTDGPKYVGGTWEWNGTTWALQKLSVSPPGRLGGGMVYDPHRKRIILFGGTNASGNLNDTWRYLVNPAASSTFGTGCAGASKLPGLTAPQPPRIGKPFSIHVSNLKPLTGGVIVLGSSDNTWNGVQLPMNLASIGMTGCALLVSWDATAGIFSLWGGSAVWTTTVPNIPALVDLPVFAQAWVLDAAANAAGIATSNGAKGVIGF